jgi:arylsulfatase A-like enzyme
MFPPESIEPWPSFPDPLVGKPWVQANQLKRWHIEGWTWQQWAPVVSRYLAVIAMIDAEVARILDVLDELGIADNTLVVYTTDHGDLCGGHGMMDKHFQMYDDVMRVPLVMRWPGVLPAGRSCDAFVTHAIDLASTFCAAGGAAVPATSAGEDLVEIAQRGQSNRQDMFAMYQGCQMGLYSQRMLRDRRWKYVYNATERDELYCVATDPGELVNRAEDPACASELRRLRARMVAWMKQIKDPLLNQWTLADLEPQ